MFTQSCCCRDKYSREMLKANQTGQTGKNRTVNTRILRNANTCRPLCHCLCSEPLKPNMGTAEQVFD